MMEKSERKIKRSLILLRKDYPDVVPLESASKNIFIGNAGLVTGEDESKILQVFNEAGVHGIHKIFLVPKKHYSFCSFLSVEDAQSAMGNVHGQANVSGKKHPLYLSYIKKVPKIDLGDSLTTLEPPPGLKIIEDFISVEQEKELLNLVDWNDFQFCSSSLKHRQVCHFGYEFKYVTNTVDKNSPLLQSIPLELNGICQNIIASNLMAEAPDQLTVNRYLPGQGIPAHIDTHDSFTDEILSLTVGGGTVMDFHLCELPSDAPVKEKLHYSAYLHPRSLCVMTGPARYGWSHGISPRKADLVPRDGPHGTELNMIPRDTRISFTFRKVRSSHCTCSYRNVCDSKKGMKCDTFQDCSANDLERKYVWDVYENIAEHFNETRRTPWPNVLKFIQSLPLGSLVLDVGCGNGKYLGQQNLFQVGCDTSFNLLNICGRQGYEVAASNCLKLPFRNCCFDAVICIAVIHHLSNEERRKASLCEMVRVLKAGGRALVYVWALEQKRGSQKSKYLQYGKVNDDSPNGDESDGSIQGYLEPHSWGETSGNLLDPSFGLHIHKNRTEFMQQDMLVPWKLKASHLTTVGKNDTIFHDNLASSTNPRKEKTLYHRYYHLFKGGELVRLCQSVSEITVLHSYYDEGNWCVVLQNTGV